MDIDHLKFILDHITPQISKLEVGQIVTCEQLIEPELWNSIPPSDHRYIFGRPVSTLIAQSKVPLEFHGFNRKRHNLYRKKKK